MLLYAWYGLRSSFALRNLRVLPILGGGWGLGLGAARSKERDIVVGPSFGLYSRLVALDLVRAGSYDGYL